MSHALTNLSQGRRVKAPATPRQFVTMAGYPWADEKNAPDETEAQILGGIYAHILLVGFRSVNDLA